MKGIIMAGGQGTRLHPVTKSINKHLCPIYNKPLIYYPLTTLMLAKIKNILVVCNAEDKASYEKLLGDGSQWGISIFYVAQSKAKGIADAFHVGSSFIEESSVALILGDNIFYGHDLSGLLEKSISRKNASLFVYQVREPSNFGVLEFDSNNRPAVIHEKPVKFISNYAVTGLYFYPNDVLQKVNYITPSKRGELEITDINNLYLQEHRADVQILSRGMAWFDAGTFDDMLSASNFVKAIEERQGLNIALPEEVAWRNGWIDRPKELTQFKDRWVIV
jgi:glucose-1-phosphate thymidylyltransferase